jgi:release factor glutamine methyltransferase
MRRWSLKSGMSAFPVMTTIRQRVADARQTLRDAGIGTMEAESSARMLAEHVLGWDTARYLTLAGDPEPAGFAVRYAAAVHRRALREPAAYITGRREFWGLPLEVSPAVLIPRPETELIVEAALDVFGGDRGRRLDVADVCTGSGNLAIALAHELPQVSITATDISEDALAIARRNAMRHAVADRIRFIRADVLDGVEGLFDLIVGNPPYVRQGDRAALQPEVRDHEPAVALFGGASGMRLVAMFVEQGTARLRPGGYLMFEFGLGQDVAVEDLITATPGLTLLGLRRDLQGIARTAVAVRR